MRSVLLIFFVLSSTFAWSQDSKEPSILSENDWKKEVIKFPIEWAPGLKLEGYEELRFSPFWSNPESDQFWSLVMAWEINSSTQLSIEEVMDNFEAYFDGLMKPNHWATTFSRPTVVFVSNSEKDDRHSFIGRMKLFDGFHTGKAITLNIKVEQHLCAVSNKTILVYRMSPKSFEHQTWDELNGINRKATSCD